MKPFLIACATGGALLLDHYQRSAESAFATTGARV
jgi:hypothetical protein